MSLRRRQRVLAAGRRHTWSSTFDSSTMTSDAVFGSFSSSSISGLIVVSSACLSAAAATVGPTTPSLSEGSLGCARFKMVRGSLKLCMISGLDVHAAGKESKTESARRYCNVAGKISASLASSGRSITILREEAERRSSWSPLWRWRNRSGRKDLQSRRSNPAVDNFLNTRPMKS